MNFLKLYIALRIWLIEIIKTAFNLANGGKEQPDIKLNRVNTRYINSEFMGKAAASDVLEKCETANKSFQVLLENSGNAFIRFCFLFFEEVSSKLNTFLRRFQTDAPMVPFLIDTLEEIVREMCRKFILDDVMEKSTSTTTLIKLNILDRRGSKLNTFLRRFQTDAPMVPFLIDTLEEIVREMCRKFIVDDVMEKSTSTTTLIKLNILDRRGFSVNKSLLVENMHAKSLVCQRIVVDHMKSNGYNSYDVPIDKKLIKM